MDQEEQTWDRRKTKGLEFKAAKRRRFSKDQEEEAGCRKKSGKKLRFSLLAEDWGDIMEEGEGEQMTGEGPKDSVVEEVPTMENERPPHPPKNVIRRGGPNKLSSKPTSKIPLITEYFGHTPGKTGRMEDVWDGECSAQEEFINLSLQYVGVRGQRARVKSPPSQKGDQSQLGGGSYAKEVVEEENDEWLGTQEDIEDFERDTAQFDGVTGSRDGDQPKSGVDDAEFGTQDDQVNTQHPEDCTQPSSME